MRPGDQKRVSTDANHMTLKGVTMSTTRIQLALNVDDVSVATAFYEKLFGVPPHKVRDGYANFAVEDPPLKLVLIEKPGASERLNHLGVEAATADDVVSALQRFDAAGLETTVAEQDVCCHATQDKVFVSAPDVPLGWWEFYAVTDDNPANPQGASNSVCEASCAAKDSADSTCCA
jgi:predicted enzyme related to lactoylglutathione lyase